MGISAQPLRDASLLDAFSAVGHAMLKLIRASRRHGDEPFTAPLVFDGCEARVPYREDSLFGLYLFRVSYFVEPPESDALEPPARWAGHEALLAAAAMASVSKNRRIVNFVRNMTEGVGTKK